MKMSKSRIYIWIVCAGLLLAQSCSATKDCGCGNDLNKAYHPARHR